MLTIVNAHVGCTNPRLQSHTYAKGEGHSLMVADFVSADYGWLHSLDGIENV